MLSGSIRLGRLAGIPLMLHWSVAVVVVLVGANLLPTAGVVATVIGVVGLLGSILVHELSHAVMARRHGVATLSVELWALGGMARLDRESPTPRAEGWIAAAGPLSSLVIAVVLGGGAVASFSAGARGALVATLGWLAFVNAVLALFNLLPGAPLDGGRIVRAWRWGRHGDRYRAAREAATAGQVIGWGLAGLGVWLTLQGVSAVMLVLTGAFIALNAKAEAMSANVQERLVGTRVRDLTWFGIAHAPADTDAETMLWQRSRLGGSGVVAVAGSDGHLAGLVPVEHLERLPIGSRADVHLDQLVVPFDRLAHAAPDDEVTDVLGRLNPSVPVVTVWDDGRLVGVVPADRLRARLRAATSDVPTAA